MIQLLFILLLVPLGAGGLLLLFSGVSQQRSARWIALGGSLVALAVSLQLARRLSRRSQADAGRPRRSDSPIAPAGRVPPHLAELIGDTSTPEAAADAIKLEFHLGLDGISVALIVLTTLLTVVVRADFVGMRFAEREAEFYAALLLLRSGADRRVLRVRPDAVLRLLRVHADSAVLPDRASGAGRSGGTRRSSSSCTRWPAA